MKKLIDVLTYVEYVSLCFCTYHLLLLFIHQLVRQCAYNHRQACNADVMHSVHLLLPSCDLSIRDDDDFTVLHYCLYFCNFRFTHLLDCMLRSGRVSMNAISRSRYSSLTYFDTVMRQLATGRSTFVVILNHLTMAQLNYVDKEGYTVLMRLIAVGLSALHSHSCAVRRADAQFHRREMMSMLMEKGVCLSTILGNGDTIFHLLGRWVQDLDYDFIIGLFAFVLDVPFNHVHRVTGTFNDFVTFFQQNNDGIAAIDLYRSIPDLRLQQIVSVSLNTWNTRVGLQIRTDIEEVMIPDLANIVMSFIDGGLSSSSIVVNAHVNSNFVADAAHIL